MPAIRFEGSQFMVTEPLELGSSFTVAVAFQVDLSKFDQMGAHAETGRQLINLNGPPHLVLCVNDEHRLISRTYAGFVNTAKGLKDYMITGKTTSQQEIGEEPVVVVSVYDPENKSSRLYLGGQLIDEARARPLEPTSSPRYIGSHMFLPNTQFIGQIAEIMVYDTALTDAECLELSAPLLQKYAFSKSVSLE